MSPPDELTHHQKVKATLTTIANILNSANIPWLLGGSGSLMVYGLDITPRDLDILTTFQNFPKLISELKQFQINSDNDHQLLINGIEVEIIELTTLGTPQSVLFEGSSIPVNPLKAELGFYHHRPGKEKIIQMIEDRLKANSEADTMLL